MFAVRLYSNRSQMTSKCGKNKKVAHEAIAECVTDVRTTFNWRLRWSFSEQRQGNMESICFLTQVILAFWLVLAYDLLEDRRTFDGCTTLEYRLDLSMRVAQYIVGL